MNNKLLLLFVLIIVGCSNKTEYKFPFQNPELETEQRVDDLHAIVLVPVLDTEEGYPGALRLPPDGSHTNGDGGAVRERSHTDPEAGLLPVPDLPLEELHLDHYH